MCLFRRSRCSQKSVTYIIVGEYSTPWADTRGWGCNPPPSQPFHIRFLPSSTMQHPPSRPPPPPPSMRIGPEAYSTLPPALHIAGLTCNPPLRYQPLYTDAPRPHHQHSSRRGCDIHGALIDGAKSITA